MDFGFSEEQEAVRELAARIFADRATPERVKEVEATVDRFDRELWAELAKAQLLGIALPDQVGGAGLGLVELCLVLEQQGRRVAPVPLWATLVVGALALAELGTAEQQQRWLPGVVSGDVVLTGVLAEQLPAVTTARVGDRWRLSGETPGVPWAHVADRVLVPAGQAGAGVFLVDPRGEGAEVEWAETTSREIHPHLTLTGAPAEALGGGRCSLAWLEERARVGLCALQVGVAEEAVRMAAGYTSQRRQFGRPLSTFQGVALRAADAYIDTEAMRATMWQAAWRLSEGLDATAEVLVAKWWAAEAGQRVVHATQHLHGGIGADVDYPIHRYFLWGKQIENMLGGASAQLARLGRVLAEDR